MYLSRLVINPTHRQVQCDLSNPYELHRTILRGFPRFDRSQERILFRAEFGWPTTILVQSTIPPDWSGLMALGGYVMSIPVIKHVAALAMETGQALYFRLRANPVTKPTGQKNRVALMDAQERLDWLNRQGSRHGFALSAGRVMVTSGPWQTFEIGNPSAGKNKITINFVDFEGYLVVTDSDQLSQSILNGIGPAKGFGCGLLSLAKI